MVTHIIIGTGIEKLGICHDATGSKACKLDASDGLAGASRSVHKRLRHDEPIWKPLQRRGDCVSGVAGKLGDAVAASAQVGSI